MRARAVTTITALLAVLAGGCARADLGADRPTAAAGGSGSERWESCEKAAPELVDRSGASPDAVAPSPLGDDFRPVSAVICRTGTRQRPGGGTEMIAEEVRAADLTALLPALRLPDEAPTAGPCTLEGHILPWLALLDSDGRWVRPGVPVDACGKPRVEFRGAFDKLTTIPVASRVVRQLESDAAAAAGCSQGWADMAWTMGSLGIGTGKELAPLPVETAARRCVYDVPAAERGSSKPAGDFRAGGPLSAAGWTAIRAEIEVAAPATAKCGTPAGSFAVLHLEPGGTFSIEGDGCRRIFAEQADGSSVYRQAGDRLLSLVFD